MVTHPAPPQTRTCAMHAYGASGRATATHARSPLLHRPRACRGQGWCALGLSPVSRQRMRCPTAPALPWVAWVALPHLRRSSAPRRRPPCPSRVASLVARFPIPCLLPSFVVSLPGSWPGGSARSRQGLWSPGPPIPGRWSRRQMALPRSRVPPLHACPARRPRWCPAYSPYRTQDCCLPATGNRRLSPPYTFEGYPLVHDSTPFGAQSRGLPARYTWLRTAPDGEARRCATDRLARR
jgi:hypothetical protein